jgi:hypothetical protein
MPPRKNPDATPKTSADYGKTYSLRLRFDPRYGEKQIADYIDQYIETKRKDNPDYNFREFFLDLLYERGMSELPTDTQQLILDKLEELTGQIKELKEQGIAIPAPKTSKKSKEKGGVSASFLNMISQNFHED